MNKEERKLLNNGVIYLAKEKKYWKGKTFMSPEFLATMMMLNSEDEEPVDFNPYFDEIDKIYASDLLPKFKQDEVDKITEKMNIERLRKLEKQLGFQLIYTICKENNIDYYGTEHLMSGYVIAYNANKKGHYHNYKEIFEICRDNLGPSWKEILSAEKYPF